MRKRNKGFTLIELLAVIVILALIALIATPIILNIIKDAKRSAAKDSAYGYIDVVEKYIVLAKTQTGDYKLELVPTEDKELTCETKEECIKDTGLIGEVNKTIKGTKPSKIKLIIKGSEVSTGTEITVDGFVFTYDGKKLTEAGETTEDVKKYKVYTNGTEIYYNPETGKKCTTAVSGCMKWYAFNDDDKSSTVNVILDHNTTAGVAWDSTADALKTDTSNWKRDLNPRLITANEVAKITGNKGWDASKTGQSWFYLDSNNKTQKANASNKSKYAWLFDYTYGCTSYGCNISDSSTYGYWASTPYEDNSTGAWLVYWSGILRTGTVTDTGSGIRPVITISKSNI
jgi:prepilin-type N-terminal cleavage/methylation domain-containing protein